MRWIGHIERMEDGNPVKESRNIEVPGPRGREQPRKTQAQLIKDAAKFRTRSCAKQRGLEKSHIIKQTSNPCKHGNGRKMNMIMMMMKRN